ncbi:hypothetical protein LPJ61_004522 [Coemansia biformis]|uniref:SGNH domain-containing protein n=1 Tax=Coemansia biformis TaxID=1286918 RepID=A0A9W7YBP6_9FUNG|nr:hypothetical protein LPJ61_004522 [Coemansia biformis]
MALSDVVSWTDARGNGKLRRVLADHRGYAVSVLAMVLLAAAVLMTGIPQEAQDRIYASTHRDLATGNQTRPVDTIIVFGDAGSETNNQQRAKLCGGSLWIDHIAEALGADLASHAHAYSIQTRIISARGRTERVVSPIGNGNVQPINMQVREIMKAVPNAAHRTLYVLVADSARPETDRAMQIDALAAAANNLILSTSARWFLVIDTPTARRGGRHAAGLSMELAARLINDPQVEVAVYDSVGFLQRMQREYYKYGLRFPDRACVHSKRRWCTKPDRFFWCDSSHVGSKAHFYMADDIIRKHLMTSLAAP